MKEKDFDQMPEKYKQIWFFRRLNGVGYNWGLQGWMFYFVVVNHIFLAMLIILILAWNKPEDYSYMLVHMAVLMRAAMIFVFIAVTDMIAALGFGIFRWIQERKLLKKAKAESEQVIL